MFMQAAQAEPLTLETLLAAVETDPVVLAAKADYDTARAEQSLRKIDAGPEVFLNASAGHYRELNSANLIDDYYSRHMAIGLRFPLLGSLHRHLDALAVSEFDAQRKQFQVELRRAERRLAVRTAYADWWRAQQESTICRDLRKRAANALKQLEERHRAGWLRTSVALAEQSQWGLVLAKCDSADAAEPQLRASLGMMVGRPLPDNARAVSVPLSTRPADINAWQRQIDRHQAVMSERTVVEEQRRLGERNWYRSVDASLSLGYGVEDRSSVSRYGNSFIAALNLSIPFNIGGHVTSSGNAAASRYQAALHRVEAARRQLLSELSTLLLGLRHFSHTLEQQDANLVAVKHKLAEQRARMDLNEEDGVLLHSAAERELALALLERVAVWNGMWTRQAALQMFTEGDDSEATLLGKKWVAWEADSIVVAVEQPQRFHRADTGLDGADRLDQGWSVGTYVWKSGALLDARRRTRELAALKAAGVSRLYVGLDAGQVKGAAATRTGLQGLLEQAAAEGMAVSLLLGEPLWMKPAHRGALLDLIRSFSDLPFASLHLDLEVEQLGWPVPEQRLRQWLDTVRAAIQESPWPIELSSHHRWFSSPESSAAPCVPCELENMGIESVSLMIYTRNPQRSAELAAQTARRWPGLNFRLAQSMETGIDAQESWAGASSAEINAARSTWQQNLQPLGIQGLDWQSWTDYRRETVGAR